MAHWGTQKWPEGEWVPEAKGQCFGEDGVVTYTSSADWSEREVRTDHGFNHVEVSGDLGKGHWVEPFC